MATIAQTTPAPKAYYCWYHDQHGILTKMDGEYVFRDSGTDELTVIEPIDFAWCQMCGEVGIATAQHLLDAIRETIRKQHERCEGCGLIGCRGDEHCDAQQLVLVAVA